MSFAQKSFYLVGIVMHVHHNTLYIRRYHFPYDIFKQRLTGYFHQCFGPIVRQRLQTGTQSRCKYHSVHLNIYHLIFNCIHDKRSSIPASGLTQQIRPMFIHCPLTDKKFICNFLVGKSQAYMIQNLEFSLGYFIIRGFRFRFMLPAITHIIENIHQQLLGKVILTGGDSPDCRNHFFYTGIFENEPLYSDIDHTVHPRT